MKLATNPSLLPCTCGNHHLGLDGETCDICMGYICADDDQEASGFSSCFDVAYFEALEAYHGGLEFAA